MNVAKISVIAMTILIKEWSRMGRLKRPWVIDLYWILEDAGEDEACEYMKAHINDFCSINELRNSDKWGEGKNHENQHSKPKGCKCHSFSRYECNIATNCKIKHDESVSQKNIFKIKNKKY